MPSEQEVERAAKKIAESPMIEAPKLDWPSWCGLARAILIEAEIVRSASNPNTPLTPAYPAEARSSAGYGSRDGNWR